MFVNVLVGLTLMFEFWNEFRRFIVFVLMNDVFV